MNKKNIFSLINVISFLFLLVASFLFARSSNMFNTSEVMPLFMPAPYAFSIWLFIYVLLALWTIWGFFATGNTAKMYEKIGLWFAATMIFSGFTILVPIEWATLFIICALISSLIVYFKIRGSDVSRIFSIPFSFLTAWLSIATIVTISLLLKTLGITQILGFDEITWTIFLLAFGTIIAILFTLSNQDLIYPLVFIWGYIAIAIQNNTIPAIVRMSLFMCILLIFTIIYTLYLKK